MMGRVLVSALAVAGAALVSGGAVAGAAVPTTRCNAWRRVGKRGAWRGVGTTSCFPYPGPMTPAMCVWRGAGGRHLPRLSRRRAGPPAAAGGPVSHGRGGEKRRAQVAWRGKGEKAPALYPVRIARDSPNGLLCRRAKSSITRTDAHDMR